MLFSRKSINHNKVFLNDRVSDLLNDWMPLKTSLCVISLSGVLFISPNSAYADDAPTVRASKLFDKAQAESQVNVIVNLDVVIPADIDLLEGIEQDQALMDIMAHAQNSLLQRLGNAGISVSNVVQFPYTAQMSMTVTAEGLLELKADAAVVEIIENGTLEGDLGQSGDCSEFCVKVKNTWSMSS